jgi:hypothetical protein
MKKKYVRTIFISLGIVFVLGILFFNPIFNILDSVLNRTYHNEQDAITDVIGLASGQYYGLKNGGKCEQDITKIKRRVRPLSKSHDFEMICNGNSFEVWAVPKTYGREGRKSFYLNSKSGIVYGGDHSGEKANENDQIVFKTPEEWKEFVE